MAFVGSFQIFEEKYLVFDFKKKVLLSAAIWNAKVKKSIAPTLENHITLPIKGHKQIEMLVERLAAVKI